MVYILKTIELVHIAVKAAYVKVIAEKTKAGALWRTDRVLAGDAMGGERFRLYIAPVFIIYDKTIWSKKQIVLQSQPSRMKEIARRAI